MKTDLIELHNAWSYAETAWEIEYTKICGPREWPGDVRYTKRAEGEPGTLLRAAYDAYVTAREAYHAARKERVTCSI